MEGAKRGEIPWGTRLFGGSEGVWGESCTRVGTRCEFADVAQLDKHMEITNM